MNRYPKNANGPGSDPQAGAKQDEVLGQGLLNAKYSRTQARPHAPQRGSSPPTATVYGIRRGPSVELRPRTPIPVHGGADPGGPAFISGRRFRRAKERAERRKGGAR